jgi:hypothetical protein
MMPCTTIFVFLNNNLRRRSGTASLLLLAAALLPLRAVAQSDQDQQPDPPSRVARLGYMEGSVSFQPAGESEWVQAVPNRPMTTGDKLWADNNSRAELQLGSAVIRLSANTGFSFLNLDDRTAQLQLTSGIVNINVRHLDHDEVFEVDTPNQAFSIFRSGSYRIEASEDGSYTVVSVRQGEGESTGNGQNFTVHAGQRATFSGTDTLRADVVQIGGPDAFDNWADGRDHRYESSRSAQYVSHDVVGYDDLDDYGDWRDNQEYGHVWFPSRVSADWAPYRDGHWVWISPWGWTWVDDSPWGYAPFHYGRWVDVDNHWGWVAGPVAVRPVYAPALVVFLGGGGGGGGGFGANIGWFPLGPREVYVPSYHVSREYVNRVNISNTTVNNTTITNVYNTTIINKTTNITNVNYANRNARGAVTAVPQQAFANSQPVNRSAVAVNAQQIASAPVSARVAVAPTQQSVFGARSATANRVAAPPAAVANRQVVAKATPPPPPVAFARQQQALAQHPGEPLARREVQDLRPANAAQPRVKQAPPGKPATPNMGSQAAGNPPNGARPGQPANQPSQPAPGQPSAARPGGPGNQPLNRPPNQPPNQPAPPSANRPEQARPEASPPQPASPAAPPARPARNDRPPAAESNRPQPNPAQPNRPQPARPDAARPEANRPQPASPPAPPARNDRPPAAEPNRPQPNPPARPEANRPAEPPARNEHPPAPAQPSQPDRRQTDQPQPQRPQTDRPPQPERPPAPRPPQPDRPNNSAPPRADAPHNTPRPPNPEEQKRQQEEQKKRQQEEQKKPPGF